jgi:hypothetical protein
LLYAHLPLPVRSISTIALGFLSTAGTLTVTIEAADWRCHKIFEDPTKQGSAPSKRKVVQRRNKFVSRKKVIDATGT